MIGVDTFSDFVKKKDLGRIKFALREIHFGLDSTDEDGKTVLHHATLDGISKNDCHMTRHLLNFGADVNIRDETPSKETPLHMALRFEHVDFIRLLLTSPTFNVVKSDYFVKQVAPRFPKRMEEITALRHQYGHPCFSLPEFPCRSESDVTDVTVSFWKRDATSSSVSSIDSCCTTATSDSVITQIERCCMEAYGSTTLNQYSSTLDSNNSCPHVKIHSNASSFDSSISSPASQRDDRRRPFLLMVRQNLANYVDSLQPPVFDQSSISDYCQLAKQLPVGQGTPGRQLHSFCSCCYCNQLQQRQQFVSNDYSDIILLQDESNFTPFSDFLKRSSNPKYLRHLIVIDCRLQWDPQDEPFSGRRYHLNTLILSNTHLRKLPSQIFDMSSSLEVLKLNGNNLEEIPEDIAKLTKLRIFCCDVQKPRLRYLPQSLSKMLSLQVLSVSGNRLEDISWVCNLTNLKVFKCDRNKINNLPRKLNNLHELQVLDISHNRLTTIPASLNDLISRLYRFDYFNVTLRPKHLQADRTQLIKYIDLESFLDQMVSRLPILDISIGVVGESQSGKSTLVEYLNQDRNEAISSPLSSWIFSSYYSTSADSNTSSKASDMLLFHSVDGSSSSSKSPVCPTFVSAVELCRGWADQYSQRINVDVFLLTIDISTIQPHNGCHQHLYQRHMCRLQMWLEALYELSPNTPVIIAGTHADHVKNSSYHEIWTAVERILDKGKQFHAKRYSGDSRLHSCLLCNSLTKHRPARRTFSKGRSTAGMLGCVDGSDQHKDKGKILTSSSSATILQAKNASSATLTSSTTATETCSKSQQQDSLPFGNRFKFPHVLAYYEVDARKIANKITKQRGYSSGQSSSSSNLMTFECYTAEQLKRAIVKLSSEAGRGYRIPRSWAKFLIRLASSSSGSQSTPFLSYEDVKATSKACEVTSNQLQRMLTYFHKRGKLVYFGSESDELLSRLVVGNVGWFLGRIGNMLETIDRSNCTAHEIMQKLADKEVDQILIKKKSIQNSKSSKGIGTSQAPSLSVSTTGYTRWLLAAMMKLEMCLLMPDFGSTPAAMSTSPYRIFFNNRLQGFSTNDQSFIFQQQNQTRSFLIPYLLEHGSPSHDVWPDNPEWEEKQITCEFLLRTLKPSFFTDLMLRLNKEGRGFLKIVSDPSPIFMSHHVVFFSALDEGGCDDCYYYRRRIRARHSRQETDSSKSGNFSQPQTGQFDEVLHKVHLSLQSRMEGVRVQVRGTSPCCTMKAVLNFLELFLDDVPDEETEASVYSDATSSSSSHTPSSSLSPSTSILYSSDGIGSFGSLSHGGIGTSVVTGSGALNDDDEDRDLFLLCPKCVLLRHTQPGRIAYHCISPKRKAICKKWHNLGSWGRAVSGDYHFGGSSGVIVEVPPTTSLTVLPDYEHPRLVLILPPSSMVTSRDWYLSSKTGFLEGLEVNFLCEYTGYWHLTDDVGYRINRSIQFAKSTGDQLSKLVNLALPLVQVIHGIPEHSNNARLVAPIIPDLISSYDYLKCGEFHHGQHSSLDPTAWLIKNKERVITMLSKVLTAAGDGMTDLYFKVNNPLNAHSIFQAASTANRSQLAKFLRIDNSSGRFGSLRPLYVEREIRWVCENHYEELKNAIN